MNCWRLLASVDRTHNNLQQCCELLEIVGQCRHNPQHSPTFPDKSCGLLNDKSRPVQTSLKGRGTKGRATCWRHFYRMVRTHHIWWWFARILVSREKKYAPVLLQYFSIRQGATEFRNCERHARQRRNSTVVFPASVLALSTVFRRVKRSIFHCRIRRVWTEELSQRSSIIL